MTHSWWFLIIIALAGFAAAPLVLAALLGAGYVFVRYFDWAMRKLTRSNW